jgi:hypothetical protein
MECRGGGEAQGVADLQKNLPNKRKFAQSGHPVAKAAVLRFGQLSLIKPFFRVMSRYGGVGGWESNSICTISTYTQTFLESDMCMLVCM